MHANFFCSQPAPPRFCPSCYKTVVGSALMQRSHVTVRRLKVTACMPAYAKPATEMIRGMKYIATVADGTFSFMPHGGSTVQ